MLLISDGTLEVSKFYFTFLQLEDYHRFKVFNYERYDPAGENNINLNNADSVRQQSGPEGQAVAAPSRTCEAVTVMQTKSGSRQAPKV